MRVVGKYCFALGDLSTTLEMTVLFITITPLGQFMERSENSWRSQFMMPCINSFKKVLLRLRDNLSCDNNINAKKGL